MNHLSVDSQEFEPLTASKAHPSIARPLLLRRRAHQPSESTLIVVAVDMSSSASRPARGYTQDYIARIRYSNALPPPAMPPKLLEIPAPGLSHYLSASWAGRLAREYPINIEADAELGMPLDLVGVPGIFDGDESGE